MEDDAHTEERRAILQASATGVLAEKFASRFGESNPERLPSWISALVNLHNDREIDILGLVESGSIQALSAHRFFSAVHLFNMALPFLDEPVERVMECVQLLVERGGSDGAANMPNAAFREWCKRHTDPAQEIVSRAKAGDALAKRYLIFALEALADFDAAKELAVGVDSENKSTAIVALGRMAHANLSRIPEIIEVFARVISENDDDKSRASVVNAVGNIVDKTPRQWKGRLMSLICSSVAGAGEFTMHQAAQLLWQGAGHLEPSAVNAILEQLQHIDPSNRATIDFTDYGLAALVEAGMEEAAIDFLTAFLPKHSMLKAEDFGDFLRTVESRPEVFGRLVVRWLLDGSQTLCEGLTGAQRGGDLSGSPIPIPPDAIPSSSRLQRHLSRKALGWFFFAPTSAASILTAILREATEDAARYIQSLVFRVLLVNYGGAKDYFKKIPADDPVSQLLREPLALYESYMKGVRDSAPIKELFPSERMLQVRRRRMADEAQEIQKLAREKSVFFNLVHHSVLLYGKGSISLIRDATGAQTPVEIELKSMGVSMEIPRTQILDPIELDFLIRKFRLEKASS